MKLESFVTKNELFVLNLHFDDESFRMKNLSVTDNEHLSYL